MLKDNHPRLSPQPSPADWVQPRRELTSALRALASQPGVSSSGAGCTAWTLAGTGHSHSESVGFSCSLRICISDDPQVVMMLGPVQWPHPDWYPTVVFWCQQCQQSFTLGLFGTPSEGYLELCLVIPQRLIASRGGS